MKHILLLFFATVLFGSIELSLKEKEFIKNTPTIILGTGLGWEPYTIKQDNGNIVGFDVDVLNAINKLTNANFKLKHGDWVEIQQEAKNKQIDGLATLIETSKRKEFLNFSKPYRTSYKTIQTSYQNTNLNTVKNLDDKTLVLVKGNVSNENYAIEHNNDYFTFGTESTNYFLFKKGLPSYKILGNIGEPTELRFAVLKEYPEAISIINKALDYMDKTNQLNTLSLKWFGQSKKISRNVELTQEEREFLKNRTFTICPRLNQYPMVQVEDGKVRGIFGEIFNEIAKKHNIN